MTAPEPDPRVFFASERTLLAWVRTGLAIIGLGYVVARFGLFLRIMAREAGQTAMISQNPVSRLIWVAFVVVGDVSMVMAFTFVGVVALATLASGLGDVVMSRRDRNPAAPPRAPNGETAAMIDAEVNEGGPPSPVPRDTPFESKACHEEHAFMSDESPPLETCPAPDRILHLPLGPAVVAAKSTTLMKSDGLELIRLVIPAGKEIPPHRAPGEITVQCLEGHVAFEHDGHAIDLQPGDLLHLCP